MTHDDARLWTGRSCLQDLQYRTDANLAARQSIYAWQRPRLDLPSQVLGLAALRGSEVVADIGCGNGAYLAELARRGHAGPVLGVDLSAGMLQAARSRARGASLVAGDAAALPLRDNASGVTMAMHMLNHEDHLRELRDLITAALRETSNGVPQLREPVSLGHGEHLLASEFTSITRHDFTGELLIPAPSPSKTTFAAWSPSRTCPTPGHSPRTSAATSAPMTREYSWSERTAAAWSAHSRQ